MPEDGARDELLELAPRAGRDAGADVRARDGRQEHGRPGEARVDAPGPQGTPGGRAAREDDRRRQRADGVEAEPLRRLGERVRAHDKAHRPVRVGLAEVLERAERPAFAAELFLDTGDLDPGEPPQGQGAHRHAVVVRGKGLGERVLVGRHDQHEVHVEGRDHERRGEQVPDVRRVEAPAEDRDAVAHGAPWTRIFVLRSRVSASWWQALPEPS